MRPAVLHLGDVLAVNVVLKAGPVPAGTGVSGVSGHRGSPRRAPEASPPAFNPSRQSRSALSLSGGVAGSPRRRGRPRPAGPGRRGRLSPQRPCLTRSLAIKPTGDSPIAPIIVRSEQRRVGKQSDST